VQGVPRRWNPQAVAAPLGSYSHLAEAPAGDRLVFISGQVGNLPDGTLAGDDVVSQARQALSNVESLLAAANATAANLMRLQSFVVGSDNLSGFRQELAAAYDRWFPDAEQGYPAHTLLVVAALAAPALLVEVEGCFTLPASVGTGPVV
jgi:2-iminobutanoate/2-iminopropanoate deaminase